MRAVVMGLVGMMVACRPGAGADASADAKASAKADASADADASAKADASVEEDAGAELDVRGEWCGEGMRGLDEDACYLLPRGATSVLVYLHGIVPPTRDSVQKQAVQRAVIDAATRAGVAAILPRGRRGIGPEGARDWWAWPTSPAAHAQLVKAIVARWSTLEKKLEAMAGRFEHVYLAGSSNGAYFISALALRGDCDALGFPVDGYGVMSGGATGGRGEGALAGRPPRPVYIGFGTYDAETKQGARALGAVFQAARWPVRVAEHPFGHGARALYLDEAFAFWRE